MVGNRQSFLTHIQICLKKHNIHSLSVVFASANCYTIPLQTCSVLQGADLVVKDVAAGVGEVGQQGLLQVAEQDLVGAHLLDEGLALLLQVRPLVLHHHIQQLLCQTLQQTSTNLLCKHGSTCNQTAKQLCVIHRTTMHGSRAKLPDIGTGYMLQQCA